MAIEIENYIVNSDEEALLYGDYLVHEIIKKYPTLSDKEKVKIIIEVIRNAAKRGGNEDYFQGINKRYSYFFTLFILRIKELEQEVKNEEKFSNKNF